MTQTFNFWYRDLFQLSLKADTMDVRQIKYLEYTSNCGVTQKPEAQIKGNVYSVNKKILETF